MVDDEKVEHDRENKRKVAGLAGVDDYVSEDVLLGQRVEPILGKYDQEIDGIQKSKFVISSDGSYSTENERLLKQLEAELKRGKVNYFTWKPITVFESCYNSR